jgi:hypothetical protein
MREQVLAVYVDHYRGLSELARAEEPNLPAVPDEFLRALVGGIAELVQQSLLENPQEEISERLRGLTGTLVRFAEAVLTALPANGVPPTPRRRSRSTPRP